MIYEDSFVTINTNQSVTANPKLFSDHQEAIQALNLGEKDAARLTDQLGHEAFYPQLERYLQKKIKLWNYAPEQRERVKAARRYLQKILKKEISYH